MPIEIYHNPRCGKSRKTLELLKKKGVEPKIRLYLEDSPTKKDLEEVLKKLNLEATALLRTGEGIYKDLVKKHGKPDNKKALDWMLEHPILIERPIVIQGNRARLGRPPEKVLDLL